MQPFNVWFIKMPMVQPFHTLGLRGPCGREPCWGPWQRLQCWAGWLQCHACQCARVHLQRDAPCVHNSVCLGHSSGRCALVPHSQSMGSCWASHRDRNARGGNKRGNCFWSCCGMETTAVIPSYVLKGHQINCPPLCLTEIKQENRNLIIPFFFLSFCYFSSFKVTELLEISK